MKALLSLLLAGWATPLGVEPPRETLVLQELTFVRAEDGVSDGFDQGGVVTADGAKSGCGQEDYVGPDGTPGIDDAVARLQFRATDVYLFED